MPENHLPLTGRTALITGVSRRRGIGFAVARALASRGAHIFLHHYSLHDAEQPWGADDLDAVRSGIREELTPGALFGDLSGNLSDPALIPTLIDAASTLKGRLDLLICNQAKSGRDGSILDMTAERLDAHWEANARASLLLTAEFARRIAGDPGAEAKRPGDRIASVGPFSEPRGRVVWMTSGQIHGPMRSEVAYITSKAALAGATPTVAAELMELGIVLNTVNPGPVNTGYLDPKTTDRSLERVRESERRMPFGRFGRPEDPAELIAWLCTSGSWMVGNVLTTDGGFRLL